ncbi:MAG: hypothetical protein ACP5GD_00385 [Candidatus Micrarchaeia archaeon]
MIELEKEVIKEIKAQEPKGGVEKMLDAAARAFKRLLRKPENTSNEDLEAKKKQLVEKFKEVYKSGTDEEKFSYLKWHIENEGALGAAENIRKMYGVDVEEECLSLFPELRGIPLYSNESPVPNALIISLLEKNEKTLATAKRIVNKIAESL